MRLKDKVAIITGAGLGMGREASVRFGKEGASVGVFDLNADAGKETAKLVEQAGGKALFIQGDVSKEADVKRAIDETVKAFGKQNILYANDGVLWKDSDKSVIETTEENWDKVQAINLKGAFFLTKHGIPALRNAGGGSIVLVGSISALSRLHARAGFLHLRQRRADIALQISCDPVRAGTNPLQHHSPRLHRHAAAGAVSQRSKARGHRQRNPDPPPRHRARHRERRALPRLRRIVLDDRRRDDRRRRVYGDVTEARKTFSSFALDSGKDA